MRNQYAAAFLLLSACAGGSGSEVEPWSETPRTYVVSGLRAVDPDVANPDALDGLIRQGVLSGEMLTGFSIIGDRLYVVALRDFDEPFFPANNFKAVRDGVCCRFTLPPQFAPGVGERASWPLIASSDGFVSAAPTDVPHLIDIPTSPPDAISLSYLKEGSVTLQLIGEDAARARVDATIPADSSLREMFGETLEVEFDLLRAEFFTPAE